MGFVANIFKTFAILRGKTRICTNTAGAVAGRLGKAKQRTEAIEACDLKIAHSEGQDWGSLWTLTQESYRDEAETVCHNCYVGRSAPQTQTDAFHNLLTEVVRYWIGEEYFVDGGLKERSHPPRPGRI